MKTKSFIFILLLLTTIICCNNSPNTPDTTSPIIVQAYLYANQPINDIRITTLGENKKFNSQMVPVNDADVSLIKQEMRYQLELSPGDSGYYYYPGDDLIVESGNFFQLEVEYQENVTIGITKVPGIPKISRISADTFFYSFRMPDSLDNELMIEWTESYKQDALYFVKMDYIWREPGEISERAPLNIVPYFISSTGQYYQNKWSFNTYSFRNDGFIIDYISYDRYSNIREGWYCFYVNQVTQDFIDLYETKFNFWGEPDKIYSNIHLGYGIFTAFGVDSVYFYAKKVD